MTSGITSLSATAPREANAANAVIHVENLQHAYLGRAALKGVSFDVYPAEIFGLLGPNGSGKTTMFRILSTLMLPMGGRAVINGSDSASDPARLRQHIGVVFQAPSIDVKLSAYENLQPRRPSVRNAWSCSRCARERNARACRTLRSCE